MSFLAAIPAMLGSVIGGAGGIGSALSAVGAVVSGVAGFAAASAQAKIAKFNADIARDNAQRSTQDAQMQQEQQDMKTKALMGEQLALQSASGLALGGRSQILTRKTAAEIGRKDAFNIRYQGEVEKINYLNQATGNDMSAKMFKMQGFGDLLGGFLKAGSIIGSSSPTPKGSRFGPVPTARPTSIY